MVAYKSTDYYYQIVSQAKTTEDLFNAINKALKYHHKVYNNHLVCTAKNTAEELHASQTRNTGEPYIFHPLRVALIAALAGFPDYVISAALLHDVVEDCNFPLERVRELVGTKAADIVDGVTKISDKSIPREERHRLTNIKLQNSESLFTIYVKCFDRIDNLSTAEGWDSQTKREKCEETRKYFIPDLEELNAYKLSTWLEDLCYQLEYPCEYKAITEARVDYDLANSHTVAASLDAFRRAFSSSNILSESPDLMPERKYFKDIIISDRSFSSIHRQLTNEVENYNADCKQILACKRISWYDITVIVSDEVNNPNETASPLDLFFSVFQSILLPHHFSIIRARHTAPGDAIYIIVSDDADNRFRFFVKTESQYEYYESGEIINTYTNTIATKIDRADGTCIKTITVFGRNGKPMTINAGSTVLDFAFMLHSELGYHFDHALLNDSPEHIPLYHKLNNGDKVVIVPNDEETVESSWIKHCYTNEAKQYLHRYFRKVCEENRELKEYYSNDNNLINILLSHMSLSKIEDILRKC